jgi:ATP-dependent helicase HepA
LPNVAQNQLKETSAVTFDWSHKLVLVRSDPRLFGKVVRDDGSYIDVEFFKSVADRETHRYPKRDLVHAALPSQTRIFMEISPGFWRVGRVIDKHKDDSGYFYYSLKFPNDEVVERSEDACFVRCLDRPADPARILAAGCIETQYFADRRRTALRRMRELRSAAQGLVGLLSAAVEFVPHQVATVRRVVTDRLLRYLLADEVGLGKTVEAGLIMRQLLLDDETLSITVVVPQTLVHQWKEELESKCLLTESEVTILSHDELLNLNLSLPPGLLVIDEAHRLIVPSGTETQSEAYLHLRALALKAPRLLLLSATPALGDEPRLFALLNLLDPTSYPLDQLDAFRERVNARQPIGRLLLAMRPGSSAFSLRQQATRAREMFPNDSVVIDEANRILSSGENQSERDRATSALKDHIANTYRIHQRLIRTRRVDVEKWTMRPRGPAWPTMTHVRLCISADAHAEPMLEALEAWRDSATRASAGKDDLTEGLSQRWFSLVDAAWRGSQELSRVVRRLLPIFEGEADDLDSLLVLSDSRVLAEDRYSIAGTLLKEWIRELGRDVAGKPKKLACFASSPDDGIRLVEHLSEILGRGQVLSLVGLGSEMGQAVEELSSSNSIRVCVCDQAAEEGLNLQFVHGMFHMNLPFDAARVEQRIGRLDRFGRRLDRIEHRVFMPCDNDLSPWRTWFSLLTNGFRVFNRSISDIQFRVDTLEQDIRRKMFRDGAYEDEELLERVVAQIAEERQKLDEQHALDDLSQLIDAGDELVQKIETSEEDEDALATDVEPWIRQVLGLRLESVGDADTHSMQVSWARDTLLPDIPWRSELEPALHKRWTWRRRQSIQRRRIQSELLRPGSILMEALERVALWDDRGIAYATWRVEPEWPATWRGFRLVWLVEPGRDRQAPVYRKESSSEVARRAEAFLPTFTVEQLLNEDGTVANEPAVAEVLQRPYRQHLDASGRQDFNLGNRPEALEEAVGRSQFIALVEHVRSVARASLLQIPAVAERLNSALSACERDVRKARRGLEVRVGLGDRYPGLVERPFPQEMADLDALSASVTTPNVRLDEIGFFIVSSATLS